MYPEWADSNRKFDTLSSARTLNIRHPIPEKHCINRSLAKLEISESLIRVVAKAKNKAPLPVLFLYQGFCETTLRTLKQIRFRKCTNGDACAAYRSMSAEDFEAINLRQAWSNWRTIPRNLNGRLPNRPVRIIDLCCGIGNSTEVLAHYAAPGSEILGLEFNPDFVAVARARTFVDEHGRPCRVNFHTQSVLDAFCDTHGHTIPGESVDLVNSSGAIGCHFDPDSTEKIAKEIARVLKPGGLATIDSGKQGTPRKKLEHIFKSFGFDAVQAAKSCVLDRYTQVCFKKS